MHSFVGSVWLTKSISGTLKYFDDNKSAVLFQNECNKCQVIRLQMSRVGAILLPWFQFIQLFLLFCCTARVSRIEMKRFFEAEQKPAHMPTKLKVYSQMASYSAKAHCWQTIGETKHYGRPLANWFVCKLPALFAVYLFFTHFFCIAILSIAQIQSCKCAAKYLAPRRNGCALSVPLATKCHCTCAFLATRAIHIQCVPEL